MTKSGMFGLQSTKITDNGQPIKVIAPLTAKKKSPFADLPLPLKVDARSALAYLTWLCRLPIPSVDVWRSWCWMFRLQLVADREEEMIVTKHVTSWWIVSVKFIDHVSDSFPVTSWHYHLRGTVTAAFYLTRISLFWTSNYNFRISSNLFKGRRYTFTFFKYETW